MPKLATGLMAALVIFPIVAHGQAMQPIKAAPSTPVAVAALGSGGGARLAPGDDIPPAALEAFVDGAVKTAMQEDHVAGVTVAVVQDGSVVLEKGYGFASYDPVRRVDPETTLFRIGSITKTFTWILIMKAVEEGKIDLDAPVNTYLPADLKIPAQGFSHEIRVRDLMTHSPGFEDRALGVLFAPDPAHVRPLERWLRETRPNRVREPGTLSSYSNYGAALAGAAVADVEGASWQDLVEQRIFAPLGLSHISVREPYPARSDLPPPMPESLASDLSDPFAWRNGGFQKRGFEYCTPIAPAGVISASAGDMARYMLLLLANGTLDGKTVFGPAAAKAFRTPMTDLPAEVGNWDAGFIDVVAAGGWHVYGHNGATLSFFSNMALVPDLRLGIFIGTNTEGGGKLSDRFPQELIENFYTPPREAPVRGALKLADAMPYMGEYISTRRPYSGLAMFVQTLQPVRVGYAPPGYLTLSAAGQVLRFVPTAEKGVFKSADEPGAIEFEMKNGRALRAIELGAAFDRASFVQQSMTLALAFALALLAAAATIVGLGVRFGRKLPRTKLQALASAAQTLSALLWLVGAAGFVVLIGEATDSAQLVYRWPTASILVSSSACLAASLFALATLGLLGPVWLSPGGGLGWTAWRKLRFSATTVLFCALGLVLALRGALIPWMP